MGVPISSSRWRFISRRGRSGRSSSRSRPRPLISLWTIPGAVREGLPVPLSGLLSIDDITVATLPRGGKERLKLLVLSDLGEPLVLRALVAVGQAPGPTLLAIAGVHGDEYEGMAAVREVFAALDPATMSGSLLAIPVANPLAYAARTRSTPSEVDGLNLARVFPGDAGGTVTPPGLAARLRKRPPGFSALPASGVFLTAPDRSTPKQRGGGSRRSGPRSPGGRGATPWTWRHMSPVCAIFCPTSAFTNTTTPRLRFVGMDQRARRSISFRLPVVFF